MRYAINFDKMANNLIPHYIGSRKLVLYIQALISPLQNISNEFCLFAKEKRIEASMTSQTIMLEWYLNRQFKKYFLDSSSGIFISDGIRPGVPIYNESADVLQADNVVLKTEGESAENVAFYMKNEKFPSKAYSFIVNTPSINTEIIAESEYLSMLSHTIEKYKISGKTYIIQFNN